MSNSNSVNADMLAKLMGDPEVMALARRTKNLMVVIRWSPMAVVVAAGALWDIKVAMYVLVTWYAARYAQFRLNRIIKAGSELVGLKLSEEE